MGYSEVTGPWVPINTLRPKQNGHHFADNILKCIFLNETLGILIKISLKFVPEDPIDNKSPLVQWMAWYLSSNRPLPEPVLTIILWRLMTSLGHNELTSPSPFILQFSMQWWRKMQHKVTEIWNVYTVCTLMLPYLVGLRHLMNVMDPMTSLYWLVNARKT